MLNVIPSDDEIKQVVFGLYARSAPGPNGFTCFLNFFFGIVWLLMLLLQ